MKRLAILLSAVAIALPASAQNAAQIDRVRAGADCPRCNLFQADLSNKSLKGKNYAGSRLRQSDLSLSVFNHANFSHTDLRDANGYGALFVGASFRGADMTNATFVGALLDGADLRGAHLRGVNFAGAEMSRAQGLSQAQLNEACGDASTLLPKGLSLPPCK